VYRQPLLPFLYFEVFVLQVAELENIKAKLNNTKSLLDDMELNKWHQHTKRMNPMGGVMNMLRKRFDPEYCSQAWCKFYECLSSFHIVPQVITEASQQACGNKIPFHSVHLCEAPGAFISATNHFLRTKFPHIQVKLKSLFFYGL
jgi:cap2 methyltransferase